ncbi:sensor histidine kinase [Cytobacillus firmus]|uniref:sensor histidine kinase n=1 Tax=Cytobacillus firmus TaxID=1399 RepID=UPI001C8DDD69|nr:histidine kinase [Cytobacillus firmus]MBX9976273.1 histidine kinase [Cytobacillus firmus]
MRNKWTTNIFNHLVFLNIQSKLLFMFLLAALIPLLALGAISYYQSSKVVNEQLKNYNHFAGEKIQKELDRTFNDMFFSAAAIKQYIADQTSVKLSSQEPQTYMDFKEESNLERLMEIHKKGNIKGIYLITSSGYYFGDYNIDIKSFKQREIWKQALASGKTEVSVYKSDHYKSNNPDRLIGLIMPLDTHGVLNHSYLLIEADADEIFSMVKVLEDDLKARISIQNEAGEYFYATISKRKDHSSDIIWKETTFTNNWSIRFRIPQDEFYRSSAIIFRVVMIGAVFALLLALALSFLFSRQFSSKILRLKLAMDDVSKGSLDSKPSIETEDEIGQLGYHFNRMLFQINQLVEEVKEKEAIKLEAEMRAVHYQINPHLLFNTLNIIQWKAKIDGNPEISKMLTHLIMVLEGNLNFDIGLVPLEDELKALKHYLAIQELRYGAHFSFQTEMESGLGDALIPRMTLQPMIENIFFHAFEDGTGEISLHVLEKQSSFQLILKDNGKGIHQEKLESLFKKPPSLKKGGIGLDNIYQKFRFHFGKHFLIEADSEIGKGTAISIYWPKRWVKNDR